MEKEIFWGEWKALNDGQNVLKLEVFRKWKRQNQSQSQPSCGSCPGCRVCVNMIQIDNRGYVCGALEDAHTGESFYVIKDGEETVDYWNCEGESFAPKPRPIKPVLKRF